MCQILKQAVQIQHKTRTRAKSKHGKGRGMGIKGMFNLANKPLKYPSKKKFWYPIFEIKMPGMFNEN